MKKWMISIIVVAVMAGAWLVTSRFSPYGPSDDAGVIHVRVIQADGEVVIDDTWSFTREDRVLFDVLDRHYRLVLREDFVWMRDRAVLGIDDVKTDFVTNFLRITLHYPETVDHDARVETAITGVDRLPLLDGMTYVFHVTPVYGGNQP